jgi:carboxyl-terminal processing protease
MKKKISTFLFYGIILLIEVLILSCSADDEIQFYNEDTNEYINEWMYRQMKKYYRWNDGMPAQGDLSAKPKEYFAKLLQKEDIYSYAVHPEIPETAPQSLRRKYGFDVSFIHFEGKYYGVILYILADSPAKNNGLKRGQLITHINGTIVNEENYEQLYKSMIAAASLSLKLTTYSVQSGFSESKQVSLIQGFSFSQPMPYQVISKGNVKIGYLEIPHFDVGQAKQFLQIFQDLKSKSITELIVDLRYNGGGDIASATALSILIAPNIKANDLYVKFEGNANGGNVNQSFKQALESNETKITFDALRAAHPSIEKVYILCGKRTASASELIINNLKPYMNVITIGDKTLGKDVAGFPIEDDRIPTKKGWILYPSIYKLYNSRSEGNYTKGIEPVIYADEIQQPEVFALGNSSEVLLKKALSTILGTESKIKTSSTAELRTLRDFTFNSDADAILMLNPKVFLDQK